MSIRRWLRASTVVTAIATLAVLSQKPFVEPYVDRNLAKARLALDRAIERQLTPEWVEAELDATVDANDLARTELLLGLVAERRIPVAASPVAKARSYVERERGILATLKRCAACAADPAQCTTASVLLYCNLPIEITVVGDVRALIEAGVDAAAGNPVDRIDVALASVGIAGTVLTPVTGGTSFSLKAGATALRIGRKIDEVGQGLGRVLEDVADIEFRWNKIDEFIQTGNLNLLMTDTRPLRGVLELSSHIETVANNAGKVHTVFLLKHVKTGKDAADLARVSKVAKKGTREAVELLGLSKAARAVKRLSGLFVTTVGLIVAFIGQLIALASPVFVRVFRRIFVLAQ